MPPDDAQSEDLSALDDDLLLARYRSVDSDLHAEGAAPADERSRALDRLAAEVLRRDPENDAFWYDRGMYAKWRADWPAAVEYNRTALGLIPVERRPGEPAAWNLGIAATALHDWATARAAWSAFGIAVPDPAEQTGAGPEDARDALAIEADYGMAPVRLNADPRFVGQQPVTVDGRTWATEVVWGRRLCPARVLVLNVPTPESGHRFGDVVLHDGDPVGRRRLGDREVGVFNEIALWDRSALPTLTAAVAAPDPGALGALSDLFEAAGGAAQDWTGTVDLLCRACSEGAPYDTHEHDPPAAQAWQPERSVGLAAPPDLGQALLAQWAAGGPARSFGELEVALT